tara:strand:+ start:116 stop:631 length:516 start_codon:yes stop_codon:yes gene_type:complete
MTTYNTSADAANTAIRAFLTKIGDDYLGSSSNTGIDKAKADWTRVKEEVFQGKCAYCGEECPKPQLEHLIMFNREKCGLHHPGNIVPVCNSCNKRKRNSEKKYVDWLKRLELICETRGEGHLILDRKGRILVHIQEEGYPNMPREEEKALKLIANNLYESIKLEFDFPRIC